MEHLPYTARPLNRTVYRALNATAQRALAMDEYAKPGGPSHRPDTRPAWAEECDTVIDDAWARILQDAGIDQQTIGGVTMPDRDADATTRRMAKMLPGWRIKRHLGKPPQGTHHVADCPDYSVRCHVTRQEGAWVSGCEWAMVGSRAAAMLVTLAGHIEQARAWLVAETTAREKLDA